jgi:hypothetical protein
MNGRGWWAVAIAIFVVIEPATLYLYPRVLPLASGDTLALWLEYWPVAVAIGLVTGRLIVVGAGLLIDRKVGHRLGDARLAIPVSIAVIGATIALTRAVQVAVLAV